jgi:hypothetical protein
MTLILSFWRAVDCGERTNTNCWLLGYTCLSCATALGTRERSRFWWDLQGRCRRCSRLISRKEGIFCANFGCQPFGYKICRNCWCPTCYRMSTIVDFLVWRKKDPLMGKPVIDEGDELRYLEARPGDALVASF